MARSLGTLTIDLVAKTGIFESGMDRASRTAETKMRKIESDAKKFGAALGTAFAAGVTTLAFQIQSSINRMDELSKAAQKVSLPTEQFSALVYAGKLADVEIGTLQTSLGRLTKAQADSLKTTSDQARVFKALGIDAIDPLTKQMRSSYDVLLDFADAFQRQQGSPEIIAAGLKLFGRSFQELIPLIKDGSQGIRDATEEASQFGQVISTETGQAAEQFNDNLSRLGSLVTGLGNAIAADLLPDLVELTNKFVDSAKNGDALGNTAKGVSDIVRVLGGAVEFVIPYFKAIDDVIQGSTIALVGYAEAAKGVINLDWSQIKRGLTVGEEGIREAVLGRDRGTGSASPASKPLVNLIDPADLLEQDRRLAAQMRIAREEAEKLRKLAFGDEPKDKPTKTGGAKKSQETIDAEQLTRAYEGLVEAGKERIALFGQEGEAAKVRYETETGSLANLAKAQKDQLLVLAEQIDTQERLSELQEAADDAVRKSTEEYEANVKANKEFIEDMAWELELLKMTNSQRNEAIALRYLNKDATDEEVQTVKDLAAAQEQAAKTAQGWDDAQRALSDSLFDAISGTKSLKDAVIDFFDELSRQILKSITDQWAEQIIGAFSQSGTSSGAQGGGWMAAAANLFGSLFGGARANGGPVSEGVPYLVGERGPELFMPSSNGSIVPNNAIRGQQVITNNLTVQGRIDRRTAAQIAQEIGQKTRIATARNG